VRENYLDLDPTYTDSYGRPLLRITFEQNLGMRLLMIDARDRFLAEIDRLGAHKEQEVMEV